MAKPFIGVAVLFMLATAVLSFIAKGNIDKLQSKLTETKSHIATVEGQARAAKSDMEKAQKDAKDADDKATTATQEAAAKSKEAEEAKNSAAEAKALVEASTAKIADLQQQLAIAMAAPKKAEGPDPVVEELKAKLADAQKETAEAKQVSESQSNHVKDLEAKYAAAELKEKKRALQFGAAGLQGRILAVNGGWNFVVLSVGDKQGVAINAPLLVVRGNEPIARLRITSVEPSTSIADVLPGSVRHGITVQPGDTVIFEGGRSSTGPSPAKPAADATSSGTVAPLTN